MTTDKRAEWNDLLDVYVRLTRDELGYPPKEWEQLKGVEIASGDVYRLKSIPSYAKGLAWEDEVATGTSPEGFAPVVARVSERSDYSTMRLSITPEENKDELVSYFNERGVFVEFR